LRPSEELAYVIGVVLGDGYAYRRRRAIKGYNAVMVGLKTRDLEFAVEFGRCLSTVLRREPIKPRQDKSVGGYVVEARSQTLYELLRKPLDLDRLKPYIEHCERCGATFLRGLFDSEGCVDKRGYIHIDNTHLRLLDYVKDLLQRLGIESTGPKPKQRRGRVFYNPWRGKTYVLSKDVYHLHVRARSNANFYKTIGFTIRRKRIRLENYLIKKDAHLTPTSNPTIYLSMRKKSINRRTPSPGGRI